MGINLNDWLGLHLWVLWAALAFLFLALELLRRDKTMLWLAGSAVVTAVVACVATQLWWLQLAVFAAFAVGSEIAAARRRRAPSGDAPTAMP